MSLDLMLDALSIPPGTEPTSVGALTIGKPGPSAQPDLYLDEGIEGLDMVDALYQSRPAQHAGEWGGLGTLPARRVAVSAWMDAAAAAGELDFAPLWAVRSAMVLRPDPTDERPICWAGLTWPGEHAMWCRPSKCRTAVDEEAVHEGAPGLDLEWVASDPVIYSAETSDRVWSTGSPVSSDEFAVGNDGDTMPFATRRAWLLRMTAHGTLTDPWVRVDHADGSWERITFLGSQSGGQVLTVGPDLLPRVGSQIASARIRATSSRSSTSSTTPLWWRLHAGSVGDEVNVVTVGCASGSFSGYVKTRSTWL